MFLGAFGGGDRPRLQRQQLVVAASAHFLKTHPDRYTIGMTTISMEPLAMLIEHHVLEREHRHYNPHPPPPNHHHHQHHRCQYQLIGCHLLCA